MASGAMWMRLAFSGARETALLSSGLVAGAGGALAFLAAMRLRGARRSPL
jgi:hypothetical protein